MSVNVLSAARFSCEFSGCSISNLHLQKLLYIAHMFHLGLKEGVPLIDESFEAWDYGPVQPILYHKAKVFDAGPVGNIFRSYPKIQDGPEKETLESVLRSLKGISGAKLVAMTHNEKGAWAKNYHRGIFGIIIPNEDIIEEYNTVVAPLTETADGG